MLGDHIDETVLLPAAEVLEMIRESRRGDDPWVRLPTWRGDEGTARGWCGIAYIWAESVNVVRERIVTDPTEWQSYDAALADANWPRPGEQIFDPAALAKISSAGPSS